MRALVWPCHPRLQEMLPPATLLSLPPCWPAHNDVSVSLHLVQEARFDRHFVRDLVWSRHQLEELAKRRFIAAQRAARGTAAGEALGSGENAEALKGSFNDLFKKVGTCVPDAQQMGDAACMAAAVTGAPVHSQQLAHALPLPVGHAAGWALLLHKLHRWPGLPVQQAADPVHPASPVQHF